MRNITELGILVFLGINSWIDIRKKEISLLLTGIFAAAAVLRLLYRGNFSADMLLSVGMGIFFVGMSIVTAGNVGMGDSLVMLALAVAMETEAFFLMLLIALAVSAIWAGILLVPMQKSRDTQIPFIPFLLLGYAGSLWLCR